MKPLKRTFFADRRGGVMIFGALALPIVIGVAGLVAEYGFGLVKRVENQRVADLAAYAGAVAYMDKKTDAAMISAAQAIGALNGVPASQLTVNLVNSPKTSGSKAVSVSVASTRPLFLSKLVSDRTELDVVSASLAEIGASESTPGCVIALSQSQSGITLSGGTSLTATNCAVSSNATVSVPCGTTIKAKGLNYYSTTAPSQPCNGIKDENNNTLTPVKQLTTDPLSGNAAVTTAWNRVATVNAITAVAAPSVAAGTDIDFAHKASSTQAQATAMGCTASFTSPKWTLTCNNKKVINIGNVTIGGGITVDFNLNPTFSDGFSPSQVTYNFSGGINNTGSSMTFPAGIYNIAKGIKTGGGTTTTFGAGTYRIGKGDSKCSNAYVSICNTSTMTISGPSTFELSAGFVNTGGSTLTLGTGTANSFKIGPSTSDNDAIILGGGSNTYLGDATGSSSVFEIVGNVNGAGGGSCFFVSAAAQHDINGNFTASGAILLGAGIYTVNGYFALGANGGGTVNCNGTKVGLKAENVNLVISGKQVPNSGSCSGYAFCVAAGYKDVNLFAPTTGALAKIAVIGPQVTTTTAGALFSDGGSNGQIGGAFYFPNGPFHMKGGASVSNAGTNCFQPIASHITLAGGTSAASACVSGTGTGSGSGSGSAKIAIVQ